MPWLQAPGRLETTSDLPVRDNDERIDITARAMGFLRQPVGAWRSHYSASAGINASAASRSSAREALKLRVRWLESLYLI